MDREMAATHVLRYTVFRGPLADEDPCLKDPRTQERLTRDGAAVVTARILWKSTDSITNVAYNEDSGLIALGSHDGMVTVLYLA